MKCPYCNQEHPDTARFCTNTGQRLDEGRSCPNCADRIPPGKTTCPTCGTEIGSAAYPLTEKAPASAPPPTTAEPRGGVLVVKPGKKRRSPGRLLACGCLGVPGVLLLLLVLFVAIDPFGLHIWGRVNGKYDAALETMPADTGVYIGINVLSATPAELEWLTQSFTAYLIEPSRPVAASSTGLAAPANQPAQQIANPGDLLQEITQATGLHIPNDLIPWVGQYGGIGLLDISTGRSGYPVSHGWVIAIEARDGGKADEFLQTLRSNVADRRDYSFSTETIEGYSVTFHDVAEDEQQLAFTRAGRMVLIASNLEGIRQMLSAQDGKSLAEDAIYKQLNAQRPREWSASLYLNHSQFEQFELADLLPSEASEVLSSLVLGLPVADAWEGVLINGAIVSAGLRLDVFTAFSPDQMPDASLEMLQNRSANSAAVQRVPRTAVIYTSGPRLDLFYESIFTSDGLSEESRDNFEEGFADQFGFNLYDDLLSDLDNSWVLYAARASGDNEGRLLDLPVGAALLAETSDSQATQDTIDTLTEALEEVFFTVEQDSRNGFSWNEAAVLSNTPFIFYGQGEGFFFLGTDREVLEAGLTGSTPLFEQTRYQELTNGLSGELTPSLYVDLDELYEIIGEAMSDEARERFEDSIDPLRAIQQIVLGSSLPQSDVLRTVVVIGLPPR